MTLNRAGHILFGTPARELDLADETLFWTYRPTPFPNETTLIISAVEENPRLEEKLRFWRAILGESAPSQSLAANHQHIMRAGNAALLAGAVDAWLADFNTPQSQDR